MARWTAVIRRRFLALAAALLLAAAALYQASFSPSAVKAQGREPVDLALVLSIDCSYSVDTREFRLQTKGTARALRKPEILQAIQAGPLKRIAVSVVQWSDDKNQKITVPWTIVSNEADIEKLARMIENQPRYLAEGGTSITGLMRYAAGVLATAPVEAERQVLDISSDGRNNKGGRPHVVRDQLNQYGITINGLTILNEFPTLNRYFEKYIIGGYGSFVIVAKDYEAFEKAIYRKLLREIIGPRLT
ncbi:MAG: DUF1194 domain-containing protein [Pseudomonadota bacterium]